MIRSTYDPEADAAYFYLTDGQPHESKDVAPGLTVDFDKDGRVVGLEVLWATRRLAPDSWREAAHPDSHAGAAE